jgi:multiple PDZ domain protein
MNHQVPVGHFLLSRSAASAGKCCLVDYQNPLIVRCRYCIVDYHDSPLSVHILNAYRYLFVQETVIVIRSLVPGGVAQQDGRLIPGDRLMFVNDIPLEHASLDTAVQALKGAPQGIVRIGVAKPLPVPDTSQLTTTASISDANIEREEEENGQGNDVTTEEDDNTEVRSGVSDMETDPAVRHQSAGGIQHVAASSSPGRKSARSDSISSDIPDLPPPLPTSPLPDDDETGATPPAFSPRALGGGMPMPATERLIGGMKKAGQSSTAAAGASTRYVEESSSAAATTDADNIPALPSALEQRVRIVKDADTLGLQVDIEEGGVNGLVVRSLTRGGTLARDGRVQPGDYLVNVNGENLRGVSQAAALAVLRRTQLVPQGKKIFF